MFGKKAETEVVEEVERELKFKEWFNLKGIRAEIKNVHWLTKKELFNNSLTVLVFTFVMGLFFFGGDAVIESIGDELIMAGMNDEGRQWYVVCTYNGHENKVKENLEKRIESMGLQDCLYNIIIPEHVETVIKDGKKINKVTNMFPGYVLVEMVMTDEAWYVVRNTSGVSGFIGSSGGGAKPFPLQKHELDPILKNMGISTSAIEIDYAVGDEVNVISGPFAGKSGTVESIDFEKETAKVLIDFLGNQTPMEIDLVALEKTF